jgi:hypothetical protein
MTTRLTATSLLSRSLLRCVTLGTRYPLGLEPSPRIPQPPSRTASSTSSGDPLCQEQTAPAMDSPDQGGVQHRGRRGPGRGRRRSRDRRREVGAEAAEPVARDVPLAGDQRAVGSAVHHLRADDGRLHQRERPAAAIADGGAHRQAARGSGCARRHHCCQGA